MNQGKLAVFKQEMASMNINILGISKLKWTVMGESDDHYIYYCEQGFLRRNGLAIIVNKRVWSAVLACNLKNDRMISVRFQGKPFNNTVIQVYAPTINADEAEQFYEDIQDLLKRTPRKDVLFIIGDWKAKVGSRDTWSNRQIWSWSTKWSKAKAKRVLPRECTGHSEHPLTKTREKTLQMDITR